MTQNQNKVKEVIRRVILIIPYVITSPFLWLLRSETTYKELWQEFLEITEDKDLWRGI